MRNQCLVMLQVVGILMDIMITTNTTATLITPFLISRTLFYILVEKLETLRARKFIR